MKILMAASEIDPFAEGPIGRDVTQLAGALRGLGHEVDCVTPLSRRVREASSAKRTRIKFEIPLGMARHSCEVWEAKAKEGGSVYFTRRDEFFDRSGLYGNESGDYQDNAARFTFFAKAVAELARRLETPPDLVHVHGWHAALVPVFLRDTGAAIRSVLSPHGLNFQGNFWSTDFGLTNLPGSYFSAAGLEFYGSMNFLKGGLLFADAIVVPGELFAAAAKTSSHGCGLENVLREQAAKIRGIPDPAILHGWDPSNDTTLPVAYSAVHPAGRSVSRKAFAEVRRWESDSPSAVFLTDACEDFALLETGLDRLLQRGFNIIMFGSTDPGMRRAVELATRTHPGRFEHHETCSDADARAALSACDLFLLPGPASPTSPWLPRALRYGCAPLAFQCDGLPQLALPYRDGTGNAFLFRILSTDALSDAARAAREAIESGGRDALARANMGIDLSPAAAAAAHLELYAGLTGKPLSS